MSFFDDASLVMIPSGYKDQKVYSVKPIDGSGDLTFSRASSATRVNSSGLVEKVRENLILQSNTLSNASWTKTNLTLTGGQTGYDGSANAWLYTEGIFTGSLPDLFQSYSTSTNIETYSFYAKAGTRNWIIVSIGLAGFTFINLSDGSIGSSFGGNPLTVTTQSLGGGWYRVRAVSPTGSKNGLSIHLTTGDNITSYNGDGTGTVYFQNFQRETGDIATDYIATTSVAVSVGSVSGLPRLDYSGGATCPSLLLEPQRTNLMTYSEQFDNAAWSKSGVTITANNVTSPDGYVNADLATATGGGELLQGVTLSTSTAYTFSFYVKKGTATDAKYRVYNFDAGVNVVAPTSYISQTNTSAWVRVSVSFTSGATGTNYGIYLLDSAYAGTMYFWGAQLEAGAYATSYVPTLGAAVTRVADAASKTGISSLIGQTEGTLFAEFTFNSKEGNKMIMFASVAGSSSYAIYSHTFSTNSITFQVWNGTNQVGIDYTGLTDGQSVKIAGAYKANDFVFYLNGTQVGTDTSGSIPSGLSQLEIGGYNQAGSPYDWSKTIKQAVVFPTRLSNADLATLTTL